MPAYTRTIITLLIILFPYFISNCTNAIIEKEEIVDPIQLECDKAKLFSYSDKKRYTNFNSGHTKLRIRPLEVDFFPVLNFQITNGKVTEIKVQSVDSIQCLSLLGPAEVSKEINISVDTSDFTYKLWIDSLSDEHCFRAIRLKFENTSEISYHLRDRMRLRLILQAKNESNQWMELHNLWKTGCGLMSYLPPNHHLALLPPQSTIEACFLMDDGDFYTECRLKYQYDNSLDSKYGKTSPFSGRYDMIFNTRMLEKPVYSNTFYQNISKARLRNTKEVL
ncbi:MAG: hypothetical protein AB8F78_18410 [Saprospiraceae bacterium]